MRLWIFLLLLHSIGYGAQWQLVWSDEFEGSELDFTKWAVEENGHGGGNNELQYYLDRPENVRVSDGHLIIEALRETTNQAGTIRQFTSGRIRTKRRASWQYGRIEVRAKLPEGHGLWPAIWMLPDSETYGRWAASGEIDIMENKGDRPQRIYGSLHYGATWPDNQHTTHPYERPTSDFHQAFHTFAIEWEANEIRWYVDEKCYATTDQWHSENAAFPAPFNQQFHLILNLAVGGNWPGPPNSGTTFPAQFQVDYVRVYKDKGAATVDGSK